MSKDFEFISESVTSQKEANALMERLIAAGNADAVFSPPVQQGEYTVITAAEARVAMGLGFGWGGASERDVEGEGSERQTGYGGGGGGGGATMTRPVAMIEIGPNGARVEPIIDPTKIVLAFVSMLISIFAMGAKLRKSAKG
jgi:uncharacterized spore protein YtfJ